MPHGRMAIKVLQPVARILLIVSQVTHISDAPHGHGARKYNDIDPVSHVTAASADSEMLYYFALCVYFYVGALRSRLTHQQRNIN